MNGTELPEEAFRLPPTSNDVEGRKTVEDTIARFKEVHHSSELDAVTKNMGMPASLLNFYLATRVDLSSSTEIGIGKAVYIPVQITDREGGGKSIGDFLPGKEELVGIYVTDEAIALRYMERKTGSSLPPKDGDVYITRIKNREGKLVFEAEATLWKFDSQTGSGHFNGIAPSEAKTLPRHDVSSAFWVGGIGFYQPDHPIWGDL